MSTHRTPPNDSRAAGWVDLDDEWEITTIPLVDRRHGLEGGGSVLARNTYADAITAAKRLGGQLATVAQLKAKAALPGAIVLTPFLGTPTAETSLHHSKLHDADVDRQMTEAGWTGEQPVAGAGKHWVDPDEDEDTDHDEDGDLDEYSHLWGWDKDGAGPGDEQWQPRMSAHKGRSHHDDGTTTEVVRRKGTTDMPSTIPPPPDDDPEPTAPGDKGAAVIAWQQFLRRYFDARGLPDPLPKFGDDGIHSPLPGETEAATQRWRELDDPYADDDASAVTVAAVTQLTPPPSESYPPDTLPSPPPWWETFLDGIPFKQAQSYYAGRRMPLEGICLHVAVIAETSTAAEGLSSWAGGGKIGVSWGYAVDNDSTRQSVKDEHTAWACPGLNSSRIHIELAGDVQTAAQWDDDYSRAVIANTAKLVAALCLKHGFPVRRNDFADLLVHRPGICDHNEGRLALLEAKRRNMRKAPWFDARKGRFKSTSHVDLGEHFPWHDFMAQVRAHAAA